MRVPTPLDIAPKTPIFEGVVGAPVARVPTKVGGLQGGELAAEKHTLNGGWNMKLKPLGDRLIVRAIEEEETTASGIVLPDTAKEKPQKGKVLAVGDGKLDDDGKRIPLDVSEGDEVLYSKYGGTEIKVDGEELLVLRESDVLARIES
jgi:chaperonin GroES